MPTLFGIQSAFMPVASFLCQYLKCRLYRGKNIVAPEFCCQAANSGMRRRCPSGKVLSVGPSSFSELGRPELLNS
jgi:hypothetical protein